MKLSAEYGKENSLYFDTVAKTHTCADLSISKALRLLQVPEENIKEFVEKNDVGGMTVKALEDEIKVLKKEKADKEELGKIAEDQLAKATKELEELKSEAKSALEAQSRLEDKLKAAEEEIEKLKTDVPAEESPELTKAKEEIEKIKAELQKQKDKLKEVKSQKQQAIEEAEAKAKEEARTAAEEEAAKRYEEKVSKALEERREALEAVEAAEKKLAMASNENLQLFKVRVDDMQKSFNQITDLISKQQDADPETAAKWKTALKQIMTAQLSRLE